MATDVEKGLCQSCRNAPGCTFVKGARGPLLECEEFEVNGAAPVRAAVAAARPAVGRATGGSASEPELMGLCQNCRVRSGCRQPKPEGGIWFCEEYEVE